MPLGQVFHPLAIFGLYRSPVVCGRMGVGTKAGFSASLTAAATAACVPAGAVGGGTATAAGCEALKLGTSFGTLSNGFMLSLG